MATEKDAIMARLGPEDNLAPLRADRLTGLITAPFSFTVGRVEGAGAKFQPSQLYYRDGLEADRLTAIARSAGPSGEIIRDLAVSRNNCVKAAYMHHLCTADKRAHQQSYCMPTYVAQLKCLTKLARATDRLCRPEFWKLSTCMQTHGKGAPACKDAWTAFDMCTEDF